MSYLARNDGLGKDRKLLVCGAVGIVILFAVILGVRLHFVDDHGLAKCEAAGGRLLEHTYGYNIKTGSYTEWACVRRDTVIETH